MPKSPGSMPPGLQPQRPKERVFKVNLKNFWVLCGIAAPFVLALTYMGRQGLIFFPVEAQDSFRYLAGYAPLATAGACVMGLLYTFAKNATRRIGVSPAYFLYHAPGKQVQFRWEDVMFTPPRPDQKPLFPTALVSDGTQFVRFEKFFFPEFEQICQTITNAKAAIRHEDIVI